MLGAGVTPITECNWQCFERRLPRVLPPIENPRDTENGLVEINEEEVDEEEGVKEKVLLNGFLNCVKRFAEEDVVVVVLVVVVSVVVIVDDERPVLLFDACLLSLFILILYFIYSKSSLKCLCSSSSCWYIIVFPTAAVAKAVADAVRRAQVMGFELVAEISVEVVGADAFRLTF